MSKKQEFIEFIDEVLKEAKVEMSDNVKVYWEAFKNVKEIEKPLFTDNGKIILKYLQDNPEVETSKSKDIAEALGMSSRTVSGAMRKLVTDGYVEKIATDPVIYMITKQGKEIEII